MTESTPMVQGPFTPTRKLMGSTLIKGITSRYLCLIIITLLTEWAACQPDFAAPLNNVSVPVGRDATFSCIVNDLGGYRVGWVKADTKAIQAIHKHVITHNSRVSVSHSDHNTWMLHIRGVQEEDRGPYMCQINTDPMRSQIGFLEVTVPPEIDDDRSSTDVMVPEGSNAHLKCRASGYPRPNINWTREDQKPIVLRTKNPDMPKIKKMNYEGEVLNLTQITRSDMGPYLCIANNGVPPIVSKRIMVEVHFRPVIHVPNQLIGVPPGSTSSLECNLEASPKSIQYWTRDTGEMLITNNEFTVQESLTNYYMTKMTLTIISFKSHHAGTYFCTAKNSLGETEGNIKVYEMKLPTEQPALLEEEEHLTQLGRSGDTPVELSNDILYGPRSREDSNSPNRYDVTHPRPNHRTPSQPSVEKDRKYPISGDELGIGPTRTPRWGWDKSTSNLSKTNAILGFLCLVGLAVA